MSSRCYEFAFCENDSYKTKIWVSHANPAEREKKKKNTNTHKAERAVNRMLANVYNFHAHAMCTVHADEEPTLAHTKSILEYDVCAGRFFRMHGNC